MEKQLPKNWINVYLQDVTKNVKGKKPKIQSEHEFDGSVPYMDIKALEHNEVRQFADIESSKHFEEGDVAMVWDGARSGWVSKTNFGAIGSTLVAFKPIKINSNYLFYYLLEKYPFINSNARGVGIPHVDPTVLWSLDFPLPPLPEQNRIVTKLDALFAQLETIKSSMANVPLLLKDFRQQVLTQAVTGKLTEEWRKGKKLKNNILQSSNKFDLAYTINNIPKNWEIHPIGNIFSFQQGMQIAKSTRFNEPRNNTLPILRIKNYHDRFKTDVEHIKIDEKSLIAEPEDIILTRTGESRGWVLSGFKGVFHNNTFRINFPKERIINTYLKYYLSSNDVQNFIKISSGRTGQPDLTHKSFGPCPILIPPLEEQQEIVSRVESLFAKADTIEKQYENLKVKIDHLPQAMLHKAFKGELTEQLESDGDARELLKEIEMLRQAQHDKKTPKVKKYKEVEEKLCMVAEPEESYNTNADTFSDIMNQLNLDYEIAAICLLTFNRFKYNYGKKYIHKMFSNIEFLNTLPVFKELTFEEKGWGMFSSQIKRAIENQKFIQFEEIKDNQKVIKLNMQHLIEVSTWTKKEENSEFVKQVNNMLTIYENPIINKKMDNIELFNTVLECMKVLETDNVQSIYTKMENWPMEEEGYTTKADKFSKIATQHMILFIKEIKN